VTLVICFPVEMDRYDGCAMFSASAPEKAIEQEPIVLPVTRPAAIERPAVVLGLLLVLASLVLYNPAGRHPFVNYDDDHYITNNRQVCQGLHWNTIWWAFTTTTEANWHPLTWLSHELDWQLFHLNPAGHHYVSVLLHAANVYLLFWVLLQATGCVWRSWIAAALFALHPINVESVAWIAERKNLLSMFFFLVALAAYRWYAQKPHVGRYGLVTVLFALGLMAKPQVITLPFVLLLWDYWPLRRIESGENEASSSAVSGPTIPGYGLSHLVLEKLPLFALSAVSAVITLKAQAAGGAVRTTLQIPMPVRIGNAALSYARYLGKAFWPSHLTLMYPYLWSWAWFWPLVFSLLLLGLVSAAVIAAHRRYLLVGWLWFLGTLVPMIGLVQVGAQAMADRYAYLPFIGLFLMASWGTEELARRQRWPAAVPVVACSIALTALGITAHRQLSYWSNNIVLWSHANEVTGPNFQAEEHLGSALAAQGRMEEAGEHFRAGVAIDPGDPAGHFNLAVYDQIEGRVQRAIESYNAVLRRSPDAKLERETLTNLAIAYQQAGSDSQAEATYTAAVHIDPNNQKTWLEMGLVEQRLGKYSEAADAFSQSAALAPSAVDYLLLEKALQRCGRVAEAEAAHQKAQQITSDLGSAQMIADRLIAQ
jgi:protein O-mannosyl-transferase